MEFLFSGICTGVCAITRLLIHCLLLLAAINGSGALSDEAASTDILLQIEMLRESENVDRSVRALLEIDQSLAESGASQAAAKQTLLALAHHGTPTALEHLRSVFETQTLRRNSAACALSLFAAQRPVHDQDWRYLVRSLPILNSEEAAPVLKALRRFRQRATRPEWVREVILIGLSLPESDLPLAVDLLAFWSGHRAAPHAAAIDQLIEYQAWFEQTYPYQPSPALPIDAATANWPWDKLQPVMKFLPNTADAVTKGAVVYNKASCGKCHRKDGADHQLLNDRLGPDLTSLGWRRQPEEILNAVLYPSHRLNDEYPVTTVLLATGKTHSGLLMPDTGDRMKVVAADGKEHVFPQSAIEETIPSRVSNMPVGLLEPLSLDEIRDLFAFLTVQSPRTDPHARLD